MKFSKLASYLEKLEATPSRLEITQILANLFKKADSGEIDKIVYLSLGFLAPSYRGVILNIAEKMMIRVLAKAYEIDAKEVIRNFKEKGDLGTVAEDLAKNNERQRERKLSVSDVYDRMVEVAKASGEGSQERKIGMLSKLLKELDPKSARFVSRIPVGRLRLGFSDKTILDALSWMESGGKSKKKDLERAYFVLPDPGLLAKSVKEKGIDSAVSEIKPVLGVPVLPMLAQRLNDPSDMIAKMGRVAVEPKLDGLRLQIHWSQRFGAKAFTRNLNENSWMFPELKNIGRQLAAKEVILDCEAVGLDEETKLMANFQTTMTRRRKHAIEETLKKIGIEFYTFDILLLDGKSLMDKPVYERRRALEKTVKTGGMIKLVGYEVTDKPERINELYRENIKKGYEGVIVKRLEADYQSGRTGWRWVKMKKESSSYGKLADTVDAIVMGYTLGKGKRADFGIGQFLVGVRKGEKFVTATKIGTGLTDEQFRELSKRLKALKTKERPKEYEVHKNYTPDFWVIPSLVVEVAADEVTKSPTHTAGLALRFPRLIKFRDDKEPGQATTVLELVKLFKMQKGTS